MLQSSVPVQSWGDDRDVVLFLLPQRHRGGASAMTAVDDTTVKMMAMLRKYDGVAMLFATRVLL